jgi:hypothetical protein
MLLVSSELMGSAMAECYLRVLDTETFVWSRLRVSGVPPKPTYVYSIDISNSDLVVFGGYGHFGPALFRHVTTSLS